ncbi:hypothetical protein [Nocardioides deserti]|uniref:ATPase n=1 Tax=Nocardioides deserti TaxID=1588644 RepID=A0ABR6U4N2_9ACTN|nr:hypothetical protein [Nocardioides deserti]MBC2959384.1 hypothetical protein [Nocardioides deserti]GGO73345.1 hypothetical protein GCM10012276_18700 [Nocardioides deserti]
MSKYADVEALLRDLETALSEMVSRDPRLVGLAEDVRAEIRQLENNLAGATDAPLSRYDVALTESALEGLRPLLGEIQLAVVPPDRTGVGADQSYDLLRRFRPHIRNLLEVLRR